MHHRTYTVFFEAQPDGGYHASCPALPGCHSEGDTLDEAIANIREAIEVYLESMIAHNETPPIENVLEAVSKPSYRNHHTSRLNES